ncbi:MAG: toxin-antitoxin system HicB family antitoxin [bacterium]|nr:toxin-antitoxin system HicB family antitoxin [bacterium]
MKQNKQLNYYLDLDYTIRLKKNGDGSYFVEVEELPGCFSEADSEQAAISMIEDAKKAWITAALERKISISEPARDDYSGKLHLRLPKFLHRSLAHQAKQEGVSLNTYITSNLSRGV